LRATARGSFAYLNLARISIHGMASYLHETLPVTEPGALAAFPLL